MLTASAVLLNVFERGLWVKIYLLQITEITQATDVLYHLLHCLVLRQHELDLFDVNASAASNALETALGQFDLTVQLLHRCT